MLSLANVYELGVTLSKRRFMGADIGGGDVLLVAVRDDGFAGTGGGCGFRGAGAGIGFLDVDLKEGSAGIGWWTCSGM